MSDPKSPSGSTDKTYTVTVYVAAPGTPIVQPGDDDMQRSQAGHVYYSISDGRTDRGYGFSPIKSGITGPGHVVPDEFSAYQNPAYSRTMEITESQYKAMYEFGEAGLKGDQSHFNLQYHGTTNSCIDFTWGALNHAGLHRERQLPFGIQWQHKDHEGAVKPLDNIRQFQRIPAPIPGSPHNREQEHPLPERKLWQHIISDNGLPPDGTGQYVRLAAAPAIADRKPFDDPVLNQMYAALQMGDSRALDQAGQQFNQSEEGIRLAERGEQLLAEQQAAVQREQQQETTLVRS